MLGLLQKHIYVAFSSTEQMAKVFFKIHSLLYFKIRLTPKFQILLQMFLNLLEISVLTVYSFIIGVVVHIISSEKVTIIVMKILKENEPGIDSCGTPQ